MARKKINFELNPLFSGPSLADRANTGSPYREIPVSDIDVDPDQPRRIFDTQSLSNLAASIKQHGVLCPVLIRVTEGGTYRLVSGERRLRATKLAGLNVIPAIIDSGDGDKELTTLAKQLVENIQRDNLTPMERALAVGQLRETNGWSIREIGKQLGVSKSQVQRSLEILELPDDLQTALIEGESESKILLLARLEDREMREVLLARLSSMSRVDIEEEIRKLQKIASGTEQEVSHGGTDDEGALTIKISADDQRLVNDIQRAVGTKVHLSRRRGKQEQGRLVIEFYSASDLSELYKRLA